MEEVKKLIEYSELAGFPLKTDGIKLTVINGSNLPYQLKRLLKIYKYEIITILENRENYKDVS